MIVPGNVLALAKCLTGLSETPKPKARVYRNADLMGG